jgi:hypothetical protein
MSANLRGVDAVVVGRKEGLEVDVEEGEDEEEMAARSMTR